MPLSPSVRRERIHTRTIECVGYRREDGLWDIEAHLVDTKAYGFSNHDRGRVEAGEPLHGMWLRVTIDDDFRIHDAEAVTDYGPFLQCADIAPAYKKLIGLTIGRGFNKQVQELFRGAGGCTHLLELLRPVATTAYQTLFPSREKRRREVAQDTKPGIIDSCYALRADGPVVAREWPNFYTGPQPPETSSQEETTRPESVNDDTGEPVRSTG